MLGRQSADEIRLPYSSIDMVGVEFRQETVTAIDPSARRVTTDANSYDADFLVVAMGADYDMDATPGLEAGGHEYYTVAGAERLRDALPEFDGGRVLVSVLGQPFKCPPAPFEGAFLLHEYFTQRGIHDSVQLTSTFPMQGPVPVTGEVSRMFREALAARGIEELSQTSSRASIRRHGRHTWRAAGRCLRPLHRHPDPSGAGSAHIVGPRGQRLGARRSDQPQDAVRSDLRHRRRLQRPPHRPQGGDLRRVGRACGRRRHRRLDRRRGVTGAVPRVGICYAEFGDGLVSKVEVDFLSGPAAAAQRNDASREYAAEKQEFGAVRRARWFGL